MVEQTLSSLPEIVPPPPVARMLVASSAAGAHTITRATHNGGQIETVGLPSAETVLLESGRQVGRAREFLADHGIRVG
jgi:hypothetical protein